jgi:hypothetical protein
LESRTGRAAGRVADEFSYRIMEMKVLLCNLYEAFGIGNSRP